MTGNVAMRPLSGDQIKAAIGVMPTLNEKTHEDEEKDMQTMPVKENVVFAINSLDEIPPAAFMDASTPASMQTFDVSA